MSFLMDMKATILEAKEYFFETYKINLKGHSLVDDEDFMWTNLSMDNLSSYFCIGIKRGESLQCEDL